MDIISKRNDKVSFIELIDSPDRFVRMRGFTEFSQNKNPIEYSRRYVDENSERNDVIGYSPSVSYSFDKFSGNEVHLELIAIFDNETVGTDAVRRIVVVDMASPADEKPAICREWTIIPDSEGTDNDAYTYSGTLKSNGECVFGTAKSSDNWQSCTFTKK